jgi:hypothetical protein
MSQLIKCTACARHVRLTETSCPFCSAALDVERRTALAQAFAARTPKRRLGRAALFAIGIGVIAPATNACSSDDSSDQNDDAGTVLNGAAYGGASAEPVDATAGEDAHLGFSDASYGAPPVFDADPGASVDAAYGSPPPFDAGPGDAAATSDGGDADTD